MSLTDNMDGLTDDTDRKIILTVCEKQNFNID